MLGFVATKGNSDLDLRRLVDAIVAGDDSLFSQLMDASASFSGGATRLGPELGGSFLKEIGHYIYEGDTALHFAAAAYRTRMVDQLVKAGANVRAKNRRGGEPLHAAAFGSPGSDRWDPAAQTATIVCLIKAGADPNAPNMDGATPLHRAVRTRCAGAVRTLIAHGADPNRRNKSGSRAVDLARQTTGRSGSGSPEAKAQQIEILEILG